MSGGLINIVFRDELNPSQIKLHRGLVLTEMCVGEVVQALGLSKVGWGLKQADLVVGVHAHDRGLELDDREGVFQPRQFCASMTLFKALCMEKRDLRRKLKEFGVYCFVFSKSNVDFYL